MAGAYAKEFEKWLQGNKKVSESDGDSMDDSGDEVDNCRTGSVVKEQDEQAPILVNNHNGSSGTPMKQQHCFQDEPPILEPVPYVPCTKLTDCKGSENDFDGKQIQTEINKTENIKDNQKISMESEKCFFKSKESENIFDKFSILSDVDDFPPPLIPSHEAHLTTVDAKDDDSFTEKSYATLQNLSPNFCAMEADSTSEMLKGDQSDSSIRPKNRHDKTFVGNADVGVECDSTCMLGASPQVVSPSSFSNVESDNQTPNREESSMSTDENPTIWNTFTTNEINHILPPSEQTRKHNNLDVHDKATSGHLENFVTMDSHDSVWDRECPKLEAVIDVNERKETEHHKRNADVDDPPILSVNPPTLVTSRMAARRKRHTIDTVESISKSKQRSYSSSKESKCNVGGGIHLSTSYSKSILDDRSSSYQSTEQKFSSSKRKESSSHTHSQNHSRPRKHRKRCQTLPIVDLVSYGSHLPKDLYKFVVNSSQLYHLQSRMYRLVLLLFPQLSSDLNEMSPDSYRFEILLKDLFFYLGEQQGESNAHVKLDKSIMYCLDENGEKEDDTKPFSIDAMSMSSKCLDDRMPTQGNVNIDSLVTDENSSRKTVSNLDETPESGSHSELNPDSDLHEHSSVSGSLFCENVKSNSSHHSVVTDSMIPRLSALSLTKENENILKCQPSVLIRGNPSAVRKYFFKLSCHTLQRLLPGLEVSLFCELANSPNDLLDFIDSVIASNSC